MAFLAVALAALVAMPSTQAEGSKGLIPGSYVTPQCPDACPVGFVQFITSKDLKRIQEFRSEGDMLTEDCRGNPSLDADVGSIPLGPDHRFEYHGRVGTGRQGENPIGHLDVVGHVESSTRATGNYHLTSDFGLPDCSFDVSGKWVAISKFGRPLTYPRRLTVKFSKSGRPLPLNLLFNYVNADAHPLTARIVKNVRCGKLRIKGQIALFKKPKQGCPFRQRAVYTVSNAKRTSKPARIYVNRAPASH